MSYLSEWFYTLYTNYFCRIYSHCRRALDTYWYTSSEKEKSLETGDHVYDISSDVLKLIYFVRGNAHKICVSRERSRNDIQKIYDVVCRQSSDHLLVEYPVIYAAFNDSVDITQRVNSYLGNRGCHLEFGDSIKIRWILTPEEAKEFRKLSLFTCNMEDKEFFDIDDTVII